jgi:hypothetical protein
VEGIWGIKQKKKEKLITDKWVLLKFYKKAQSRYVRAAPRHVSSDSGPNQSEIVLTGQNFTILKIGGFLQFRRIPVVLSISRTNVVVFWN